MKKLINKLEKWAENNKNKANMIGEICEKIHDAYPITITLILVMAGKEGCLIALHLLLINIIFGFLAYAIDTFLEKWKKGE